MPAVVVSEADSTSRFKQAGCAINFPQSKFHPLIQHNQGSQQPRATGRDRSVKLASLLPAPRYITALADMLADKELPNLIVPYRTKVVCHMVQSV